MQDLSLYCSALGYITIASMKIRFLMSLFAFLGPAAFVQTSSAAPSPLVGPYQQGLQLAARAKQVPAAHRQSVAEMAPVLEKVSELHAAGKDVLAVFDFDDTLMTARQDLASKPWIKEQFSLMDGWGASDQLKERRKVQLFKALDRIEMLSSMRLTDEALLGGIATLQASGIPTLCMTSRPLHTNAIVKKALASAGINLRRTAPGSDFDRVDIPGLEKPVGYQDGVLFVARQHKGKVLQNFLDRFELKPDVIVFTDDSDYKVDAVFASFNGKIELYAYDYTREHGRSYDREIARIQLKALLVDGEFLTNEEARGRRGETTLSQQEVYELLYDTKTPEKS